MSRGHCFQAGFVSVSEVLVVAVVNRDMAEDSDNDLRPHSEEIEVILAWLGMMCS